MVKKILIDSKTKDMYEAKANDLCEKYLFSGNSELKKDYDAIMADLKHVRVIDVSEKKKDVVYVGSNVIAAIDVGDGEFEEESFKVIIGTAHDVVNEVSVNSPVGEAIIGSKVGDECAFNVRGVSGVVKIIACENNIENCDEKV